LHANLITLVLSKEALISTPGQIATMMLKRILIALQVMFCSVLVFSQNRPSSIWLEKQNNCARLMIGDKPFLILGGELGNSSVSNMEYMRPYLAHLRQMNLNTLLAPVYWELLEPEENRFDFSLVDSEWGIQKLNLYNSPKEIVSVKSGLH